MRLLLTSFAVAAALALHWMHAGGQRAHRGGLQGHPHRLVAVGDLHGDLEQGLATLQLLDVVDAQGQWNAGDATLVQTGDILDRGGNSLDLVRLFHRLRGEAEQAGGQVITLLGNHELMNMQHQINYVSPIELQRLGAQRFENVVGVQHGELLQEGVKAWLELLNDGGLLAEHITKLPTVAVVGEGLCRTIFCHAGLLSHQLQVGLNDADSVNQKMWEVLRRNQPHNRESHGLTDSYGPLWNRVLSQEPESMACPHVDEVLRVFNATQMVIGHTVQKQIKTRCQGRLQLIDIGISRAYRGRTGGWECVHGMPTARYQSVEKRLVPSPASFSTG